VPVLASHRLSLSRVVRESLPAFVEPMLLSPGPGLAVEGTWAVEVKLDGIRAQLRVDTRSRWTVRSRPGRDCTHQFPELAELANQLGRQDVLLDGELAHLAADGRPDLGALRRRLVLTGAAAASASASWPATFVAFDVLHLGGHGVRALPYRDRRLLLDQLAGKTPGLQITPAWLERFDDVVAVTRAHELEGVVFKRLDSVYRPGRRSAHWRKHKHRRQETVTVTAWTPGDREPDVFYVSRLDDNGEPVAAGGVQLGLSAEQRQVLRAALDERETDRRRRVRRVAHGVELVIDAHGRRGGELRDAVIREVRISP
jgi:ATP-dependent DNA ligase